jgi:hypothetical protein
MEITIPDEPQERSHEDDRGILWRYMVKPVLADEMCKHLEDVGQQRAAIKCALDNVTEILEATYNGEPVGINGKAATDPSVLPLLLRANLKLCIAATDQAWEMGRGVMGERGNSESEPA